MLIAIFIRYTIVGYVYISVAILKLLLDFIIYASNVSTIDRFSKTKGLL